MKKLLVLSAIIVYATVGVSQSSAVSYFKAQETNSSFLNPFNGIEIYEEFNGSLGGRKIRYDDSGILCQGWLEDYYENGQLLHKGYYVDGKLKAYKNYYPNGTQERIFKKHDWRKSKMKVFYADGKLKSKAKYFRNAIQNMESYYANGNQQVLDKLNRNAKYYIISKSYYENGKPKSILALYDKEEMLYNKIEYFSNGKIKEQGDLRLDLSVLQYQKEGRWKTYNEDGTLASTQLFTNGKPMTEADQRQW